MNKILKNHNVVITSPFGERKKLKFQLVKRFHKGIDIRTVFVDNGDIVCLPEHAILIRKGYQKKWGWYYVFRPRETEYTEIKFIHMSENTNLIIGDTYHNGYEIGFPMLTNYMKKNNIGFHLHFETWGKYTCIDPTCYLLTRNIPYSFKEE